MNHPLMKMMTPPNSVKLLPRRLLLHHLPSNGLLRLCLPLNTQSIKTLPLRIPLKMLSIKTPRLAPHHCLFLHPIRTARRVQRNILPPWPLLLPPPYLKTTYLPP
jgi:hypothetical protein